MGFHEQFGFDGSENDLTHHPDRGTAAPQGRLAGEDGCAFRPWLIATMVLPSIATGVDRPGIGSRRAKEMEHLDALDKIELGQRENAVLVE